MCTSFVENTVIKQKHLQHVGKAQVVVPGGRTPRLDPRLLLSWNVSWSLHEARETESTGTVQWDGECSLKEIQKKKSSYLLAGKEDWSGGQAQLEVCSRGLPQVTGSWREVQDIVHQLQETDNGHQQPLQLTQIGLTNTKKKDCKRDLEGDADIPPVLKSYFVNFRVRIHQDGNLKQHTHTSHCTTKDWVSVETTASLHSETFAWWRNVHTALQLFAMRLAVFLKVFSR